MQNINVCVFRAKGRKFYQCQWTNPVTGKKKTRSTGTNLKRDAERFAGQIEKELRGGTYREQQRITWEQFRDRYETEVLSGNNCAQKTKDKYQATFNAVERLIKPKMLSALDEGQISLYASRLRKEEKEEPTIKGHLSNVRSMLNWAERQKLIQAVPHIEMPKRTAGMKGRPITSEEYERMLESVPKIVGEKVAESWRYFLTGLWWSGLRLGEALKLHWTDDRELTVDFDGRRPMFRIQASAQKSNKAEILPMAPEFAEFLMQTPEEDREGYIFNPLPRCLLKVKTGRLSLDSTSRIICDIGEAANVKVAENSKGKVKFASAHDLRRAFGFRWSMRVMPAVLQQLMRHESIETTMQFYVGKNAEVAADALWESIKKLPANTLANTTQNDAENDAETETAEIAETP